MGSSGSVEGTTRSITGPTKWWTCNLNPRTELRLDAMPVDPLTPLRRADARYRKAAATTRLDCYGELMEILDAFALTNCWAASELAGCSHSHRGVA